MKKIITYGTFDLFHKGHLNILKRAKEKGDYLIVGVTAEVYDVERGKLGVVNSLHDRIENVKKTGLADYIIVEQYDGQKISDIQKYNIDEFVIGSDWKGKFEYLKEFCTVSYLERTKNISSTELRMSEVGTLQIGIIGSGRIAKRFVVESKYVSGCNIFGVCSRKLDSAKLFAIEFDLGFYTDDFNSIIDNCDIIYIATPHTSHFEFAKKALKRGKHVLCEKPLVLNINQLEELFQIADDNNSILLEGIKTAFCPGFNRVVELAKCGIVGEIHNIDATFTKLENKNLREFDPKQGGGSFNELASYPLLALEKILGEPEDFKFQSIYDENNIDIFTKGVFRYKNAFATLKVGLGVKAESDLIISGTKGYIYVRAPWWKTQEIELKFEDSRINRKFFNKFEGDGLRYEIAEIIKLIREKESNSWLLSRKNMLNISRIVSEFNKMYR